MSYEKQIYRSRRWYISHELLIFEVASGRSRPSARTKRMVWENLILIKPRGPEEAYRRVLKYGRLSEHTVKIDSQEGYCKFRGLGDLVFICDTLEDGSENEWHDLRLSASELNRPAKKKHQMQAFNIGPAARRRRTGLNKARTCGGTPHSAPLQ